VLAASTIPPVFGYERAPMTDETREVLWSALVDLAPAGTPRTWQALSRAVPAEVAPPAELIEKLSVSPPEAAEVSEAQLRDAAARARKASAAESQRLRHAAIRSQAGLIGGIMVGLWLTAAAVLAASRVAEPVDLAKGKPWRASSQWGGVTCDPVHGMCGPLRSRIFFHTLDDDAGPWVEIDLGKPETFRKMTIVNRKDENLQDRAVPLLIEVSDDQQSWRQIARRDQVFDEWKPEFEPVTARFVRAKIARKSWLHLEAVKVHP